MRILTNVLVVISLAALMLLGMNTAFTMLNIADSLMVFGGALLLPIAAIAPILLGCAYFRKGWSS